MDVELLKKLLSLSQDYNQACILLSNGIEDVYGEFEIMAGFGVKKSYEDLNDMNDRALKFGFISYDYKNKIENLLSNNSAYIKVQDVFFFEPEYYYLLHRNGRIETNINIDIIQNQLPEFEALSIKDWIVPDKKKYINNVNSIKEQIRIGDFYELNYCTEWVSKSPEKLNPYSTYLEFNAIAPAPFSAFLKHDNQFLLCSSPERFVKKRENKIYSQPIKGTRKRGTDAQTDFFNKTDLMNSEKDRAENVMITDLVRNDLSRCCVPGSVVVDELCAIRSFSHVHQMVSSISGQLKDGVNFKEIVHSTFPMGSMTGAPKVNVMKNIEDYESFRRGWYSGTVGYLYGDNFDLNVVIRSIQYDQVTGKLAYHVGGAITYDSIAESEFEECLVKAAGIQKLLGGR